MFSVEFLDKLRETELEAVLQDLRPGSRLLEFGAGTGVQARKLAGLGFDVTAIDMPSSGYAQSRCFPVIDYDGRHIPLADQSTDVIFSSNVLEHVEDFPQIAREFRRITAPGGYGVHLMPSTSWRAWTLLAGPPNTAVALAALVKHLMSPPQGRSRKAALASDLKTAAVGVFPVGHGTAGEAFSELYTFSTHAWRRRFRDNGFEVAEVRPVGIFHTGHQLFGAGISVEGRRRLAKTLGSAATIFVVRPT